MNKSNIIIFDAYGTLFKINSDKKSLSLILGDKKNAFLQLWRQKLITYSWLTSLMSHWEEFNTIVDKALIHCCKVHEIDYEVIKPIMMDIYQNPKLFPSVRKMLEHLNNNGNKCCVMSNGEEATLLNAIQKNGIETHIDQVFSASKVQKYKVSPIVYRMATAHYNTGPSKMYFVSSNAWDITGASNFGYTTVWINRQGGKCDDLLEPPDYEIKSLAKLPTLF